MGFNLVLLRCGRSSAAAENLEHPYPMRDGSGPHLKALSAMRRESVSAVKEASKYSDQFVGRIWFNRLRATQMRGPLGPRLDRGGTACETGSLPFFSPADRLNRGPPSGRDESGYELRRSFG